MAFPPRTPYRYVCSQCDWKGPVQDSDFLCGPFGYPYRGIKLVQASVNTLEHLGVLAKLLKIFKC